MTEPDDLVPAKLSPGSFTPDTGQPLPDALAATLNEPSAEDIAAARLALLANGADVATRLLADLGIPDQN